MNNPTPNNPGKGDDDQVEIDLSGQKNEYEMKEIDPYADGGEASGNKYGDDRSSHVPVNHNNINLNNFGSANFASHKSDDPAMYSQKQN